MRFSKFLVFLMVSLVLVSEFAVVFRLVPSVKATSLSKRVDRNEKGQKYRVVRTEIFL